MNLKKYFDFSGTINGTTYFLRNLLSGIVGFIGGYFVGIGVYEGEYGLAALGLAIVSPAIAYQMSTVYKRMNALFPENALPYTIIFGVISIGSQFVNGEDIKPLVSLIIVVLGCILIFKNSKIETHNG